MEVLWSSVTEVSLRNSPQQLKQEEGQQDTLSLNPSWPSEILRNAKMNNGHRITTQDDGSRNTLGSATDTHSPPLPSILLANIQSLENKMVSNGT
ncbi:zinc finger protein 664-like isoform X1 [Tachysurus ichikawai]